MEFLDLVQGTEEWLESRLNNLCASEAPAMMGASKFMSRNQLLDLKKGWQKNPDSSFKKRLFEKGHLHEDQARQIIEMDYCEDFPPRVGRRSVDGIVLQASFDGISEDLFLFEHKDWNLTLAENVRNCLLEPEYYWQLEHQMLVADVKEIMFVCSDGTEDNKVSMIYDSVPELRCDLINGWKQFLVDLDSHVLEAKTERVTANVDSLPAIKCTVSNGQITTNIQACLEQIKDLAHAEMSKTLETDQDFANKEQQNKDVKSLRAKLKEKVEEVRSEFVTYAEFESVANELDSVLQKMQADGERKVKAEKEAKKRSIVNDASDELCSHISAADKQIEPFSVSQIYAIAPDWQAAIKNKRTIESIKASVDEELALWKVEVNKTVELCAPNVQYLKTNADKYAFLFHDANSILRQSAESFAAVVDARISKHEAEQKQKLEEQREAIRREEEAKLLAKQEQEKAWNDSASYALAQMTSEEVQDALNWLERQSMHSGDAVYDKCLHDVREHYHALIKNEAEIQQQKKEAQASQTKAYVENTAVGIKPAPEVPAPEVAKTAQAPIECVEYQAIELVVNRAYEWGIASDKVDALAAELKQLLGV